MRGGEVIDENYKKASTPRWQVVAGDPRPGKQRRCQWHFSSITALARNTLISVTISTLLSTFFRPFYLQQKKGTRSRAVKWAGNVAQNVQTRTTFCSATAWQQQLWCAIWWSDLRYDFNLWQLPSGADTMLYNENVGLENSRWDQSQRRNNDIGLIVWPMMEIWWKQDQVKILHLSSW